MKGQEFRCSQQTAMTLKESDRRSSLWTNPWLPVLGLSVVVDEHVAVGKLQLWEDGKLVKERDIDE